MKFVSKNNHYRVVLKQGVPGNPQIGQAGTPGLYVLFKDGVAIVTDEEEIELMKKNQFYGSDFVEIKEETADPFALNRKSMEPEHDIMELEGGVMKKNLNPKPRKLNPAAQKAALDKMINDKAVILAKKMIDEAVAIKAAEQRGADPVEAVAAMPAEEEAVDENAGKAGEEAIEEAAPAPAKTTKTIKPKTTQTNKK